MENFAIQVYSLGQLRGIIGLGYTLETSHIITDLLQVFGAELDIANQSFCIDPMQQNTSDFMSRLDGFVESYKMIIPQIQGLGERFKKLKEDEWFLVLPPIQLNTMERYELEKELRRLNKCESEISEDEIQSVLGRIISNYEIITFNLDRNRKIKIGEGKKDKRVCRFCGYKIPEVSFNNEAHAISEALGNKKLILNEECDDCNTFFDRHVERDFIHYHDLTRTIFGVKNKDNVIPKMKGKNFKLSKLETGDMSIAIMEDIADNTRQGVPKNVVFNTGNKINRQNIYKALCKFALSVIASDQLSHFSETINWLNGKKSAKVLPKVAVMTSYKTVTKRPEIVLNLRASGDAKLPFLVAQFKFTFYTYIFIVPFSDKDSYEFINDTEYEEFLSCFEYIRRANDFAYVDFSEDIDRELSFNINFEQVKSKGDQEIPMWFPGGSLK